MRNLWGSGGMPPPPEIFFKIDQNLCNLERFLTHLSNFYKSTESTFYSWKLFTHEKNFLSGNTVGEKQKSAERRNNYRLCLLAAVARGCASLWHHSSHYLISNHWLHHHHTKLFYKEVDQRGICWLVNVPATCWCISGRICTHSFTCCHTETEVADQTFYLTQSQYSNTGPTSPSADLRDGSAHTVVRAATLR